MRVALEDLADQILAKIEAGFRIVRQIGEQFVVAFQVHGVAVIEDLLGFAQGDQNGAQMGEQGEVMIEVGVGHDKNPVGKTGAPV
ncbi:hypothetical protein D3C71_1986110 [compost metagenome]